MHSRAPITYNKENIHQKHFKKENIHQTNLKKENIHQKHFPVLKRLWPGQYAHIVEHC